MNARDLLLAAVCCLSLPAQAGVMLFDITAPDVSTSAADLGWRNTANGSVRINGSGVVNLNEGDTMNLTGNLGYTATGWQSLASWNANLITSDGRNLGSLSYGTNTRSIALPDEASFDVLAAGWVSEYQYYTYSYPYTYSYSVYVGDRYVCNFACWSGYWVPVYETRYYTYYNTYTSSYLQNGQFASDLLRVEVQNVAPTITTLDAQSADFLAGGEVLFSGAATDPGVLDVLTYAWDFDSDGNADATGQDVSWIFTDAGLYDVTLSVSDGDGGLAVRNYQVDIAAPAPIRQPVAQNLPTIQAVPEPTTLGLVALGIAGLGYARRRRT